MAKASAWRAGRGYGADSGVGALLRGELLQRLDEMFQSAQWAMASEAAASLAQMAAREAKGDTELARLVRERQDLVGESQARDRSHITAASRPPGKRNKEAEAANTARLEAIDKRIGDIDQRLRAEFPDYTELARPVSLSVTEVQGLLGPDEALVLFLDTPERKPTLEETFIWVITKSAVRRARSDFGTPRLKREVAALRCGLDYDGAWGAKDKQGIAETDQGSASMAVPRQLP